MQDVSSPPSLDDSCSSAEHALKSQGATYSSESSVVRDEATSCRRSSLKVKRKASKGKVRESILAKPTVRHLAANKATFKDLVFEHTGNPSQFPLSAHRSSPLFVSSTTYEATSLANRAYPDLTSNLPSFSNPAHSYNSISPFFSSASFLSPYLSLSQENAFMIQDKNNTTKTLEFLLALSQSLLPIDSSQNSCTLDFGLSGQTKSAISRNCLLECFLQVELERTLNDINTCLAQRVGSQVTSSSMEHLQSQKQLKDLESFLLDNDFELDSF